LKEALVIHPVLSFYAGGEYLCLTVCEALQELGYRVTLASHSFNPAEFERLYGMGGVMEKCNLVPIPQFRTTFPRFVVLQKLEYSRRVWPIFRNTDAEVVFSTQSSPFVVPRRMFHFVYSVGDLFGYPHAAAPLDYAGSNSTFDKIYLGASRRIKKFLWNKQPREDWIFAMGSQILSGIRKRGYDNSSLAFPPCRTNFHARLPKRKQVVQAARIIPDKRLELYFEIASRLPEYKFYLVGKTDKILENIFPGYAERILSKLPGNVTYVDASVRDRPELLEESEVYLYTGIEPGIGLAMVEGMAAGCVPFSPIGAGAADVLKAAGVGALYRDADEAVRKITMRLKENLAEEEILAIAEGSRMFGPESFKHWIKTIVNLGIGARVPDSWSTESLPEGKTIG
jgi:glycosyltransferase involved in cell wall biosynthesis